jgi:hypothetical protein
MASLIEDIELVEAILGDVTEFAAGKPASVTKTFGTDTFTISVQILASGPVAPFNEISGNLFAILGAVLTEYALIASGAPVSLAAKLKNTWYGITITMAAKAAA